MAPSRVLVVEDQAHLRKLVESLLLKMDIEVCSAAYGGEGIEYAQTLEPDLIVLDYVLPDMEAPQFMQLLLEAPETREIPVVVISGHQNLRALFETAPTIVDFLRKPFDLAALESVVANVLMIEGFEWRFGDSLDGPRLKKQEARRTFRAAPRAITSRYRPPASIKPAKRTRVMR